MLGAGGACAEEGNIFSNLLKYGGTTVPPSQPKETEAAYCPTVDVAEGRAAIQAQGGAGGVRSQTTFGQIARECSRLQDGSVSVKVGVEARVLLGPGGSPGRFEVPLSIAIKNGDKVVTSRAKRFTVVIESGQAQGFATMVEDGLIVPPALAADYEIEVGLGGGGAKAGKPKPRRKPPVATTAPEGGEPGAAQ
ncbi:hypothetical protein [Methylobacterium trifolii]|nr:hypothetical protein [Methylobacterium trifolii]